MFLIDDDGATKLAFATALVACVHARTGCSRTLETITRAMAGGEAAYDQWLLETMQHEFGVDYQGALSLYRSLALVGFNLMPSKAYKLSPQNVVQLAVGDPERALELLTEMRTRNFPTPAAPPAAPAAPAPAAEAVADEGEEDDADAAPEALDDSSSDDEAAPAVVPIDRYSRSDLPGRRARGACARFDRPSCAVRPPQAHGGVGQWHTNLRNDRGC